MSESIFEGLRCEQKSERSGKMYRFIGLTGVIGRFAAQVLTSAVPISVIPTVHCTDSYEMEKH